MLSDEQLQEWARQAAFSTMGEVREVLDRVVAMTAEACAKESIAYAKTCRQTIKNTEGLGMRLRLDDMAAAAEQVAAAIREKARTK